MKKIAALFLLILTSLPISFLHTAARTGQAYTGKPPAKTSAVIQGDLKRSGPSTEKETKDTAETSKQEEINAPKAVLGKILVAIDQWIETLKHNPTDTEIAAQQEKAVAALHAQIAALNTDASKNSTGKPLIAAHQEAELVKAIEAYIPVANTVRTFRDKQRKIVHDVNARSLPDAQKFKLRAQQLAQLKQEPEAAILRTLPKILIPYINIQFSKTIPQALENKIISFMDRDFLSYLFGWKKVNEASIYEMIDMSADGSVFTVRKEFNLTPYIRTSDTSFKKTVLDSGNTVPFHTSITKNGSIVIAVESRPNRGIVYKRRHDDTYSIAYRTVPDEKFTAIAMDGSSFVTQNNNQLFVYAIHPDNPSSSYHRCEIKPHTPHEPLNGRAAVFNNDGSILMIDSGTAIKIYHRHTAESPDGKPMYQYQKSTDDIPKENNDYIVDGNDDGLVFATQNISEEAIDALGNPDNREVYFGQAKIYVAQANGTYSVYFDKNIPLLSVRDTKDHPSALFLSRDGTMAFVGGEQITAYRRTESTFIPIHQTPKEQYKSIRVQACSKDGSIYGTTSLGFRGFNHRIYQKQKDNSFKLMLDKKSSEDSLYVSENGSTVVVGNTIYQRKIDGTYDTSLTVTKGVFKSGLLSNDGSVYNSSGIYATIPHTIFNETQLRLLYTFYQHALSTPTKPFFLTPAQEKVWLSIPAYVRGFLKNITVQTPFSHTIHEIIDRYKKTIFDFYSFYSSSRQKIQTELTVFFNTLSDLLNHTSFSKEQLHTGILTVLEYSKKRMDSEEFHSIKVKSAQAWEKFCNELEKVLRD